MFVTLTVARPVVSCSNWLWLRNALFSLPAVRNKKRVEVEKQEGELNLLLFGWGGESEETGLDTLELAQCNNKLES